MLYHKSLESSRLRSRMPMVSLLSSLWRAMATLSLMIMGLTTAMLATAFPLSTGYHIPCNYQRLRSRNISFKVLLWGSSDSSANDYNSGNDEIERLRESASILRAQVMAAQEALASKRPSSVVGNKAAGGVEAVQYDNVADSCWEIT